MNIDSYRTFGLSSHNVLVRHIREVYPRTKKDKGWAHKPTSIKLECIRPHEYENWVRSVPFFNQSGTCRTFLDKTCLGNVPVTIITVLPYSEEKLVDHFELVPFPMLAAIDKASSAELEILNQYIRWERRTVGERELFTFYHYNGEQSATYDCKAQSWIRKKKG